MPTHIGPTWDRDVDWDRLEEEVQLSLIEQNLRDPDGYMLPELTLGWQIADWIEKNLLADEVDPVTEKPLPFALTAEQLRFLLWFYAIDELGRFAYREVVLQRLKGWG